MKKLFGTDGIRGIANEGPMTPDVALKIGQAVARLFSKDNRKHCFVIGKDPRLSGDMLESALAAGICAVGHDVLLAGVLPSPGVAFVTRSLRADAGIMISASHNPHEYNGVKIFNPYGFKLPDEDELQIEEWVLNGFPESPLASPEHIGRISYLSDGTSRYVEFVKGTVPRGLDFSGFKFVLDCANGASSLSAKAAFHELGAEVVVTGDRPNGLNINKDCGSLHPKGLAQKVREEKADAGFAFDGDADRLIAITEKGEILDGDHILAMVASHWQQKNLLKPALVVSTIMANMGLKVLLGQLGVRLLETQVGDRFVMECMEKENALIGGEQSGHIIFRSFHSTGDGLITALQIAAILAETKKPLSAFAGKLVKYPQYIKNVRVRRKEKLENIPDIMREKNCIEEKLGATGRLVLRYSGTEPCLRIMIESADEIDMEDLIGGLMAAIETHLCREAVTPRPTDLSGTMVKS